MAKLQHTEYQGYVLWLCQRERFRQFAANSDGSLEPMEVNFSLGVYEEVCGAAEVSPSPQPQP